MRRAVVVTTGGTIASQRSAAGGHRASLSGADLLARVEVPDGVTVEVLDAGLWNGFALQPTDMGQIAASVRAALADEDVDGVVLTHGTDTTEETAFLLDLVHDDPRPVVVTGAQRPADDPRSDGPANLRDALLVATAPAARGAGVVVCFDGSVRTARGVQKVDTLATQAFGSPSGGLLGRVSRDGVHLHSLPQRPPALDLTALDLGAVRVDVVALYPGADAVALRAHVAAGADGVVLQGMGAGNAPPALLGPVTDLVAAGVPVVLSTRVPTGPVVGIYGGGGGADLLAAGALPSGLLRPGQARVLLLALLAARTPSAELPAAFAARAVATLPVRALAE
ncbi:asparaginase [Kineococcus gynurae]|uniref:asparaginase n=1 Tax=Kineococcus gynurae TaxID=452979 RepID=A0ABV5LUR8_9ACTN